MKGHKTAEARSLAYHRAIALRLPAEPDLITRAKQRVDRWAADSTVHPRWVEGWRHLLALPLAELCVELIDEGQAAIALRQATPFAGAIAAHERWAIIRALRETD